MFDLYFKCLIIPIVVLPVLYFLKLLSKKAVLTLWFSFVSASLTDCIFDSGLISSVSLAFFLIVINLILKQDIIRNKNRCFKLVLISKSDSCDENIVYDGKRLLLYNGTLPHDIGIGDVLMVNNYENLSEFV